MKKLLLKESRNCSRGLLNYGLATAFSFYLYSCNYPRSLPVKNAVLEKADATKGNLVKKFALPIIIPISPGNRPKIIKAGKPVIKKDSSNGGVPFFTNYGTDQGLPLSSVSCSMMDRAGNLWFGTAGGGVSRYDGKSFISYSVAQGLASNVVFAMLEDKTGDLWFGTTAGVSEYNGSYFKNYTTAQGLAGNFILCMMQDRNNNIWFGTHENGASKYDGKKFSGYSITNGMAGNYVHCMMQDKNGHLWFGTDAGGISTYDGNSFKNYTTKQGLLNGSVNSISQDKAGNIWIGTTLGASKYNGSTFTNYRTAQGITGNNVRYILQDQEENIWLGTQENGVSKYDGKKFIYYNKAQGLPNNVSSITEDNDCNLWFTSNTGDGVTKYQGNSLTSYTSAQGLAGNFITCIMQDKNCNLWFGTYDGGISKYDGKSFMNYSVSQGLSDILVWSILQDKEGNIWIGTDRAGVNKFDGESFINYTTTQGLVNNTVNNIMQDKDGNIWFGTDGGVSKFDGKRFFNYTTAQGLAGNNVQSMIQDKTGNIWFATHDNGVSKYNGKSFATYTTDKGLISNTVYNVMYDRTGDLWFGTNEGASKFNGKNFVNYTTSNGLPDNYTWATIDDSKRQMTWFATNQGLSGLRQRQAANINTQDNKFQNFNKTTGYLIKDISTGALFLDNNGILWIGCGHNELLRFNYSALGRKNTKALKLEIQDVKVNNETICWNNLLPKQKSDKVTDSLTMLNEMVESFGKVMPPLILDSLKKKYHDIDLDSVTPFYPVPVNLVLPYKYHNVTIDFVAISPSMSKQVKYQYKLQGYNEEWSPLSNNTSAVFGNISAGKYIFKLRALSPSGIWSEITYTFKVLPPWWLTWWAYILYGLITCTLLYSLYKNHIRVIERKQAAQINLMVATQEEERKRISRDLHDDIGTKLSALKLSLSSLQEKAIETNNGEIRSMAENSAQFITEAMQDIRKLLLNLSPSIVEEFGYNTAVEGLVNKINETGKIHFNFIVFGMKERLEQKYELALYRITQELINNVIKHAEAKNVTLQAGRRDKKIIVMIEDDGKGFDINADNTGYGLQNLNERTKLMQGVMVIDSKKGKGTSILIEIPYNFNEAWQHINK